MKISSRGLLWLLCILLLLGLRLYKVDQIGLFDFDSARNYEKALLMNDGDFSDLFHHAAPLPNLFYAFLALLSKHIVLFVLANTLLNLVALYWIVRSFRWRHPLLAFCMVGVSFLMVSSSRYVSIESLSLFFFGLWLFHFTKGGRWQWLLLGMLMLCNYKAVLILFFVGLWELYKLITGSVSWKSIWAKIFAFVIPIMFVMVLGWTLGLAIYQYPATLFRIFYQPSYIQSGSADYTFYFQFLGDLEMPLVVLSPLLALVFVWQRYHASKDGKEASTVWLPLAALAYFGIMCLLPKAPRGIIFLLPLMYLLTYYFVEKYSRDWVVLVIVLVSMVLQTYRFGVHIYPYEKSDFVTLDQHLRKHKIKKIGYWYLSQPFHLDANVQRLTKEDLKDPSQALPNYILVDCFVDVVALPHFDASQYTLVWEGENHHLLIPMIFLENAEYTRLSYDQAWQSQKERRQKPCSMRLYKLRSK